MFSQFREYKTKLKIYICRIKLNKITKSKTENKNFFFK